MGSIIYSTHFFFTFHKTRTHAKYDFYCETELVLCILCIQIPKDMHNMAPCFMNTYVFKQTQIDINHPNK